nr:hypothetical protein BaRGS_001799 [Batillaria attramentaria]
MVNRETFLANVCNHLEDTLDWSLAACLETFQRQNLFQSGMSVTVHDFQADRNFEAMYLQVLGMSMAQ